MVTQKVDLPRPLLCLVTDRRLSSDERLPEVVTRAIAGGLGMVILREKDMPPAALLSLARRVRAACGDKVLFFVNGNAQVALAAGAHGVHLSEAGMAIQSVRRIAGPHLLIGRSVHSVDSAVGAQREGADYLIVGTVFETGSKPGKKPEGLELLRSVGKAVHIPFLAVGGVTSANVGEVMEAGAIGPAVISAIQAAPDPKVATRDLCGAMRVAVGLPAVPPIDHKVEIAPTEMLKRGFMKVTGEKGILRLPRRKGRDQE